MNYNDSSYRAPEPKAPAKRWVIKLHSIYFDVEVPCLVSIPLSEADAFAFARNLITFLPPHYRVMMEPAD